jgi:hypothetical protein
MAGSAERSPPGLRRFSGVRRGYVTVSADRRLIETKPTIANVSLALVYPNLLLPPPNRARLP